MFDEMHMCEHFITRERVDRSARLDLQCHQFICEMAKLLNEKISTRGYERMPVMY